jgi:transposase InsO family protein
MVGARRFTLVSEAYLAPSSINRDAPGTYQGLGITVERVMTDNGSCCKSFSFHEACKRLGLKPTRTKPYTPKTNGKAEGFIQTSLREWAYAQLAGPTNSRSQICVLRVTTSSLPARLGLSLNKRGRRSLQARASARDHALIFGIQPSW